MQNYRNGKWANQIISMQHPDGSWGCFHNLYNSNVTGIDFMDRFKFEEIIILERTYAVFETEKQRMPIPEYFDIRKQIAAEWLSNEEYQMINAPELAVYHWGIVGGYADRTIEIWIPIEKK